MKIRNAVVSGLVVVALAVSANAQQRPEPLPTEGDGSAQNQSKAPIINHFPCTSAEYDKFMKWQMGLLQQTASHFPQGPGEFNKVVLRMRECASKIELDGYVTQGEYEYCDRRLEETIREIELSYQMTQQ
ncbi:MAG TPA: hypothetical protein VGH28_01370 [Polyangiaceae bacterium]|jgi:hypothetical protein